MSKVKKRSKKSRAVKPSINYFAYGSNLSPGGMASRAPQARQVGRATLPDWRLTFRGVADIEPKKGQRVEGVIWKITQADLRALDRYEGYPSVYDRRRMRFEAGDSTVPALVYVMAKPRRDLMLPSTYYQRILEDGFEAAGLDRDLLYFALTRVRRDVYGRRGITRLVPDGKKRMREASSRSLYVPPTRRTRPTPGMSPATRKLLELDESGPEESRLTLLEDERDEILALMEWETEGVQLDRLGDRLDDVEYEIESMVGRSSIYSDEDLDEFNSRFGVNLA